MRRKRRRDERKEFSRNTKAYHRTLKRYDEKEAVEFLVCARKASSKTKRVVREE